MSISPPKKHYRYSREFIRKDLQGCHVFCEWTDEQNNGRAWVVDSASSARLKVSFFWPFRGDYWIIDLGPEYEYVVVGTPNRKYLWILSRTPEMEPEILTQIIQRVEKQGFIGAKLVFDYK